MHFLFALGLGFAFLFERLQTFLLFLLFLLQPGQLLVLEPALLLGFELLLVQLLLKLLQTLLFFLHLVFDILDPFLLLETRLALFLLKTLYLGLDETFIHDHRFQGIKLYVAGLHPAWVASRD